MLCMGGVDEILPDENIYEAYENLNNKINNLNNLSDGELMNIKINMRKMIEEKYTLEIQVKNFIKLFRE